MTGDPRRFAVAGWPVLHSRSPGLYAAGIPGATCLRFAAHDAAEALEKALAEELWARLGRSAETGGTLTYADFPVADPALLVDDTIEVPIQINGKVRSKVVVGAAADRDELEAAALADAIYNIAVRGEDR